MRLQGAVERWQNKGKAAAFDAFWENRCKRQSARKVCNACLKPRTTVTFC